MELISIGKFAKMKEKLVVGYCRVSTAAQKDDFCQQVLRAKVEKGKAVDRRGKEECIGQ